LHSTKIDVALYGMCQTNRRNRQCQRCGQPLASVQPMFSRGLTHRPLNLALSGDAELFEQLSDARVEDVLFHHAALRSLGDLSLARKPIKRAAVCQRRQCLPIDVRWRTLGIVCEPCGGRVRYTVEKLMAEHGDANLTELLATIANCPKTRKAKDQGDDNTLTVIRLL
jgi:hypothetical protein